MVREEFDSLERDAQVACAGLDLPAQVMAEYRHALTLGDDRLMHCYMGCRVTQMFGSGDSACWFGLGKEIADMFDTQGGWGDVEFRDWWNTMMGQACAWTDCEACCRDVEGALWPPEKPQRAVSQPNRGGPLTNAPLRELHGPGPMEAW